jgi:NhaP-type Na+/H+ or K+/H+ antiporter
LLLWLLLHWLLHTESVGGGVAVALVLMLLAAIVDASRGVHGSVVFVCVCFTVCVSVLSYKTTCEKVHRRLTSVQSLPDAKHCEINFVDLKQVVCTYSSKFSQ